MSQKTFWILWKNSYKKNILKKVCFFDFIYNLLVFSTTPLY